MEMPIRVIITLFVAVVVAIIIVQFAGESVDDAKMRLNSFGDDEMPEDDKIMEMKEVSSHQVAILVDECYKKHSNVDIEDVLCYVLLGEMKASASGIKEESNYGDQLTVDISSASNAVRIKYNAALDKVEVKG